MTTTPTSGAADLRATFSEMLVDLPNTEPFTLFKAGFDAALAAGQATAAQAVVPADQDDSLHLCASDLQHSAIYDNHVEMQSCMRAVADRITALAPAQPAAQHYGPLRDADAEHGKQLSVYSTPRAQPAAPARDLAAVIKGAADKLDAAVRCHPNAVDTLIHEALEILDGDREPDDTPASRGQTPAGATLPDGWVPLTITHEGQYPEEVAYGPQIMMDRLGKWLGKYFARAAQTDSVLEDAARLDWLELAGPTSICRVIARPHDDEVEVATDDVTGYGKTLREAIDAASKQGGKP